MLDFVGAPEDYVHQRKQFGAWFMDPASKEDKIWVMENFFKTKKFAEYNSVSDLLGTKIKNYILIASYYIWFPKNVFNLWIANRQARTIKLKDAWGGTGHVVYNNSLYYNK